MAGEKIALYLRLSRDDERTGESSSIENQRSYLTQYVHSRGGSVAAVYTDDGYTGTNFDRPGFRRLLGDIDTGRIDTVITKDLSRLGRDQIGTAYYYQIYFPKRKVRYIAAAEGFDTAAAGGTNALFPFLTAANDFYTADISRKVRAALSSRKREGKFIGASPPIGYQKDPAERGRLIAEARGAEIVRHVFRLYLAGGSVIGAAKALTEQGIPTPAQCKDGASGQTRFPGVWSDTMVRRILTNPTYAGHLTQNRREKVNYKVNQSVTLPKSAWIVVQNTHEALVSQPEFDRVQEMIAVRSYARGGGSGGHLLTGLAFCADCGSPMTYVRQDHARVDMVCQGYRKGGRLHLCTAHRVRESAVLEAIQEELRALAGQVDQELLQDRVRSEGAACPAQGQLNAARQRLERLDGVLEHLYRDRADATLLEQEFQMLLKRNREERAQWAQRYEQAEAAAAQETEQRDVAAQVRSLLSFAEMERTTVTALIDRVLIHEDKTIELLFRFCRPE